MFCEVLSDSDGKKEKLVSLIMGGDRQAVDVLFSSYMSQLRRTAAWMVPNIADSEDALQDGLLLAYRNLNQFQGRAKFSTWLHSIVINAARTKLRRLRARTTTSIDRDNLNEDGWCIADFLVDPESNPEQKYMADEQSRILKQTIEDLPITSRTVVQLMDIDGFSGKEAAQMLGISLSALKARHLRARRSIICKFKERQKQINAP